jgi:hypothetical protein
LAGYPIKAVDIETEYAVAYATPTTTRRRRMSSRVSFF